MIDILQWRASIGLWICSISASAAGHLSQAVADANLALVMTSKSQALFLLFFHSLFSLRLMSSHPTGIQ